MTVINAAEKFATAQVPADAVASDQRAVRRRYPATADPRRPEITVATAPAALALVGVSPQLVREQLLLTALARVLSGVMNDSPDPVNAAMDLLAAEDLALEARVWDLVSTLGAVSTAVAG